MVEIIRPPADELTVTDLLINSLGLAGALALAAVPLGLIVGYAMIKWNARRPPEADHMPHVIPSFSPGEFNEPGNPPSAPVQ